MEIMQYIRKDKDGNIIAASIHKVDETFEYTPNFYVVDKNGKIVLLEYVQNP